MLNKKGIQRNEQRFQVNGRYVIGIKFPTDLIIFVNVWNVLDGGIRRRKIYPSASGVIWYRKLYNYQVRRKQIKTLQNSWTKVHWVVAIQTLEGIMTSFKQNIKISSMHTSKLTIQKKYLFQNWEYSILFQCLIMRLELYIFSQITYLYHRFLNTIKRQLPVINRSVQIGNEIKEFMSLNPLKIEYALTSLIAARRFYC